MKCGALQSVGKVILFALLFSIIVAWSALTPAQAQTIGTEVQRALQTQDTVRVIVALKLPVGPGLMLADRSRAVQQAQNQVMASVRMDDFQVVRRYAAVPALAGIITARGLAALLASPAVERVDLDAPGSGGLAQTVPHIKADVLHNIGLTGNGVTIAVLDSGIDSDHPDLSDALVGEQCFCSAACCPNGSWTQNGAGAAEDDNGHGTHVTGIITGNGQVAPVAVAPGTNIVAIKVLDANNIFCCSSDIVAGLDYILADRPDVKVVNMSLGTFATFAGNCDNDTAFTMSFARAINALTSNGVSVFAASHNFGLPNEMSAPACVANTISMGAVNDDDNVADFSNSGPTLDLLAPGVGVTAAEIGGGTSTRTGTSMASSHAAGTAALLLEAFPELIPADILNVLKRTGVMRVDPKNGLSHPRIDAEAAFLSLNTRELDTTPPIVSVPPALTVEATGPGGAFVTFSATATDPDDEAGPVICAPPSGSLFAIGTTTVSCTATDSHGNTGSASFTVTVRDTTPPTINGVTPSQSRLWPPDQRIVPITLDVDVADLVTPTAMCQITTVSSNEPGPNQWTITGPLSLSVVASRTGGGTGRMYTIDVTCADAAGNLSAPRATTIVVPHDQGK